jgi:DNA polymerase-3 subunit alpha
MLLNTHTYYSLRYGTFSEKELLQLAQGKGYSSIVLTDINNTSACLNFIRLAPKHQIKPLVGIDFRNGAQQKFVGIAKNNNGFKNLNTYLSYHSHHKKEFPDQAPQMDDVFFIYPFEEVLLLDKINFRTNECIGVNSRDLKKIRFTKLFAQKEKFVLLQTVTFRNKRDFNVHRLLRAIDNNVLLSKLDPDEQGHFGDVMLSHEELKKTFKEFDFILQNTERLLQECVIHFDFSENRKSQNKKTYTGSSVKDENLLLQLCEKGLKYRYAVITTQIRSRIKKELDLIKKMEFVSFFLVNWDIVQYAKKKGYYHIGRGSGANSIVAYLLEITDVDPIDLDLYFERFMNLYRVNPPDFDIDFSWRDREDITRYIFERFGKNGTVALLATYNTFQHSGAIRELGKVFGLPKQEIDLLSSGNYNPNRLDEYSKVVHRYSKFLNGIPNHLSIHAGGIIISEKPIHFFTATNLPPKGFPTTQFDMVVSEDVGLYKYDILAQRALGKIKDALTIIKENKPQEKLPDIHHVRPLLLDENINKMISQADCIGCFCVESPAMRSLLKKLEVNNYLGLVAASSIIRPGVSKSGMMREYILRHKNPERRKQAHPVMRELMEDTYGVMVYQEDVIKVAHHFAGLDLGEADVLRRGMSGKFRSRKEFQRIEKKFIANCREKGYEDELTFDVWKQVESFAGYAFAKGHSASYAVESYQSLYLKCYYPLEFMVAVLNNGGGFYKPETYIHEARMKGAIIHSPCVNNSRNETIIKGNTIYLGFHFLYGLNDKMIDAIITEREENGAYQSLDDFLQRVLIGVEHIDVLIRINAFKFTKVNKREMLWNARYKINHQPKSPSQHLLFKGTNKGVKLPKLHTSDIEDAFDQIELLGFPLVSPFTLLKNTLPNNSISVEGIKSHIGKVISLYGYLVVIKSTKTSDNKRMSFGTFIGQTGDWIDTVHFPPVNAQFPFRGKGVYKLTGKVVNEFGFLSIEVESMYRLPYVEDVRYAV